MRDGQQQGVRVGPRARATSALREVLDRLCQRILIRTGRALTEVRGPACDQSPTRGPVLGSRSRDAREQPLGLGVLAAAQGLQSRRYLGRELVALLVERAHEPTVAVLGLRPHRFERERRLHVAAQCLSHMKHVRECFGVRRAAELPDDAVGTYIRKRVDVGSTRDGHPRNAAARPGLHAGDEKQTAPRDGQTEHPTPEREGKRVEGVLRTRFRSSIPMTRTGRPPISGGSGPGTV
jgi:hypothetical protein